MLAEQWTSLFKGVRQERGQGGRAKWFLIEDGVVSTYQRCGNDHQEHTVTPGRHTALLDAMQSIHEQ